MSLTLHTFFTKTRLIFGLLLTSFISFICSLVFLLIDRDLRYRGHNVWAHWTTTPNLYCEEDRSGDLFRNRVNSYTCLSYGGLGLLLLHFSLWDYFHNRIERQKSLSPFSSSPTTAQQVLYSTNRLKRYPSFSLAIGCVLLCHSTTCLWTHACLCTESELLHWTSGYSVLLFPFFFTIYQFYPRLILFNPFAHPAICRRQLQTHYLYIFNRNYTTHVLFIWLYTAFCLVLFVATQLFGNSLSPIAPILLLVDAALLVAYYIRRRKERYLDFKWLALTGVFIIAGGSAFVADGLMCDSGSFVQFHPVWHLMCGAGLFCLYLYFRSETARAVDASSMIYDQVRVVEYEEDEDGFGEYYAAEDVDVELEEIPSTLESVLAKKKSTDQIIPIDDDGTMPPVENNVADETESDVMGDH
eukprot:TRINITY_DN1953_c0_g1_i1.p1 TRINITY_DN1953_c0_g1~~TRINITY_DN1953_c0_g1_i1.p1  ORF type:complete len:413 (+),score=71.02 TRINITY_DN1953_c0_g1_i1:37-1275(+)